MQGHTVFNILCAWFYFSLLVVDDDAFILRSVVTRVLFLFYFTFFWKGVGGRLKRAFKVNLFVPSFRRLNPTWRLL